MLDQTPFEELRDYSIPLTGDEARTVLKLLKESGNPDHFEMYSVILLKYHAAISEAMSKGL